MADNFDRLRQRPQMTDKVTLALDPNDAAKLLTATVAARKARTRAERTPTDGAAAAEAEAAEQALADIKAGIVTFTVHACGIGPRRVEELLAEHRPTQQQIAKARRLNGGDPAHDPQFDEDKFPPALIAEAVTRIEFSDDPDNPITGLSVEQATELWMARWSQDDKAAILRICMAVDQVPALVGDLGKG